MGEITKYTSRDAADAREYEQPVDPDREFMARVAADPGFRFQLSQLLRTYGIPRYAIDSLDYRTRPFADISQLITHLDLDHLPSDDRTLVVRTVLEATIEVRDELDQHLRPASGDVPPAVAPGYIAELPFPLQLVIMAKACAGHDGSSMGPVSLLPDAKVRGTLHSYMSQKFDCPASKATEMIDTIMMIHGAEILAKYFAYGASHDTWRSLTIPPQIVDVPAPRIGYRLPNAIEEGLRSARIPEMWRLQYLGEEHRQVDAEAMAADRALVDGLEWIAQAATDLADRPHEERALWRGYVITSLLAEDAFAGSTASGYSAGLDQLVSWRKPRPDSSYPEAYSDLESRLARYAGMAGELSEAGVLLALVGQAVRIGHDVEREIIYSADAERYGRVGVVADILARLAAADHPVYAADVTDRLPLLTPHLKEAANRWSYRFS